MESDPTAAIESDIPHMFASFGALFAANLYFRERSLQFLLLTLSLLVIASSTRLIGITLTMVFILSIFFYDRKIEACRNLRDACMATVVMGLVAGLWMGRNALISDKWRLSKLAEMARCS